MLHLKELREQNNLSQETLAKLLDITQGSISQWECGKSNPSIEKLLKLCQILECSIDDIIISKN